MWAAVRAELTLPVRAVRKPNSVPSLGCPQKGDDHLSSHDDCSPRSSDLPGSFGRAILERFPIWSCSVRGLPCLGCHHPSGALLPHHFTLTSPFPERRYIFCGTFLPVTGTGSYPAHCPGEVGLSSDLRPAIIWSTRTGKTIIRERAKTGLLRVATECSPGHAVDEAVRA